MRGGNSNKETWEALSPFTLQRAQQGLEFDPLDKDHVIQGCLSTMVHRIIYRFSCVPSISPNLVRPFR